jgi:hypothetical protein
MNSRENFHSPLVALPGLTSKSSTLIVFVYAHLDAGDSVVTHLRAVTNDAATITN